MSETETKTEARTTCWRSRALNPEGTAQVDSGDVVGRAPRTDKATFSIQSGIVSRKDNSDHRYVPIHIVMSNERNEKMSFQGKSTSSQEGQTAAPSKVASLPKNPSTLYAEFDNQRVDVDANDGLESSEEFIIGVVRERCQDNDTDSDNDDMILAKAEGKSIGVGIPAVAPATAKTSTSSTAAQTAVPATAHSEGLGKARRGGHVAVGIPGAHRQAPTTTAECTALVHTQSLSYDQEMVRSDIESTAVPFPNPGCPEEGRCTTAGSSFFSSTANSSTYDTSNNSLMAGDSSFLVEATLVDEALSPPSSAPIQAIPVQNRCCIINCSALSKRTTCVAGVGALLMLLAVSIGIGLGLTSGVSDEGTEESSMFFTGGISDEGTEESSLFVPTLEQIRERGVLRCGVGSSSPALHFFDADGERSGFDVALCRALAAAVLGEDADVDFKILLFRGRFLGLADNEVDVIAAGATHTMERQVFEENARTGFTFSSPYLYEGLQLAGDPMYVECLEDGFKNTEECSAVRVCTIEGTSHEAVLSRLLPGRQLYLVSTYEEMTQALVDQKCSVIAHEGHQLQEAIVRELGYQGNYTIGRNLLSKEPLAMVTRRDDPEWSSFVNTVLHGLFLAEKHEITESTSHLFPQTKVFGEDYRDLFRNAISVGGNYGELYSRFLEPVVPRKDINLLNFNKQAGPGLMLSLPLGAASNDESAAVGHMEQLQLQGKIKCGIIPDRPGFAAMSAEGTNYHGIEIDLCSALSAALYEGFATEFEIVPIVNATEGYSALSEGLIDVFAGASWDLHSYTHQSGNDTRLSFSPPYFYNTIDSNYKEENLCLVTTAQDHSWSAFVYWVVESLILAEEERITADQANQMPEINLFGPSYSRMLRDVILSTGNYGQLYNRTLQEYIPRSGRNLLNSGERAGPQHYPIPGLKFTD